MVVMELMPINGSVTVPLNNGMKMKHDEDEFNDEPKKDKETMVVILSAAYAKLLVAMGIAFPLAEVISPYIRDSFYVIFYLYLYVVSFCFLIYVYAFLLSEDKAHPLRLSNLRRRFSCDARLRSSTTTDADSECGSIRRRKKKVQEIRNCGSFYLRVGAIAFGIGSMIYSGLEFVQFFETGSNAECYNVWDAIKPCVHMGFTFIQLYFIFLNSKMCIHKYQSVARFGLMHMVATNLCVWLRMVVQESKHEILHLTQHQKHAEHGSDHGNDTHDVYNTTVPDMHMGDPNLLPRHFDPGRDVFQLCQRQNILGQLVQNASPFLFPCTIEYSLICAAISYVMWKNIGKGLRPKKKERRPISPLLSPTQRHQYSVDCTHTMKGLFVGILVLVASIISVILFFVLINRPAYRELAVMEAHISELVLFTMTTVAVFIAMIRIRHLPYNSQRNVELDSILLIVAQLGVYFFSIFSIIAGHLSATAGSVNLLVGLTAFSRLFQATCQTVFILDASQRTATNLKHVADKPGREMITLLLVCNFAMWIIKTMKTGRPESNPVQLDFYGLWGWTIISRISTPLAIFFRFHSTVCLCEIWKKIYKLKKPERENNNGSNQSIAE